MGGGGGGGGVEGRVLGLRDRGRVIRVLRFLEVV